MTKKEREAELAFAQRLLADIGYLRKKHEGQVAARPWNTQTTIKAELIGIIDFAQKEIELFLATHRQ